MELTQKYLKSILRYDPETRDFIRIKTISGRAVSGMVAGTLNGEGYIRIQINGKLYLAHRLAFLYMTGKFPPNEVDHKDDNKSNNAWSNLRHATSSQNEICSPVRANNTSGLIGVSWNAAIGKWVSRIFLGGKYKHLGCFTNKIEARDAYIKAFIKYRGKEWLPEMYQNIKLAA